VYNSGLSPAYAGLVPDLIGKWYGFVRELPYLKVQVVMFYPYREIALTMPL